MMMEGLEQMLCGLKPAHSSRWYWNVSAQDMHFALHMLFHARTEAHSE